MEKGFGLFQAIVGKRLRFPQSRHFHSFRWPRHRACLTDKFRSGQDIRAIDADGCDGKTRSISIADPLLARRPGTRSNILLPLHRSPQPLDEYVLKTTSTTVHADLDLVLHQHLYPLNRAELAALVRVENLVTRLHRSFQASDENRRFQRIRHFKSIKYLECQSMITSK